MSSRRKRIRKVVNPPTVKGFKPFGIESKEKNKEVVNLLIEEYEALRLCDYEHYNHFQASVMMDVSRPTFTRIYAAALQKIATAFVEGREIRVDGGKVYFDSDWYQCSDCHCYFNNPEKNIPITHCPLCKGKNFVSREDVDLYEKEDVPFLEDLYVCVNCQHEYKRRRGKSRKQQVCPQCGNAVLNQENNNK